MAEKFVMVAYDISENSIRNRLIDILFYYGLARVQYSVFLGYVGEAHFDRMAERIRSEFEPDDVKILIVEICKGCFKNIISINYDIPKEKQKNLVV